MLVVDDNSPDGTAALVEQMAAGEPRLPRWLEITFLVLLLVVAGWFRVYHIDRMPPGIFIDETNTALDALRILEGHAISLFGTGWFEIPNAFVYLQSLIIRLLGTTFWAIKIQSILPGLLTVFVLYFLGRQLFGVRPARFATAFLAFDRSEERRVGKGCGCRWSPYH